MNARIVTDRHTRYTRISKRRARQLYAARIPFALCPVKLRPGWPGWPWVAQRVVSCGYGVGFETEIRFFEHYNCSHEAGYYTAFYTMEDL